mmetsp:Transcript_21515/g.65137  ORF Transcript_21515/g.65137 Transcript_21515/m.65137 type:complete len:81 (-) Transcript_21515:1333-1575(-)
MPGGLPAAARIPPQLGSRGLCAGSTSPSSWRSIPSTSWNTLRHSQTQVVWESAGSRALCAGNTKLAFPLTIWIASSGSNW